MYTQIQLARATTQELMEDTIHAHQREERRLTEREHSALRIILDEIHRLNEAVSTQEAKLHNLRPQTKKHGAPKPGVGA